MALWSATGTWDGVRDFRCYARSAMKYAINHLIKIREDERDRSREILHDSIIVRDSPNPTQRLEDEEYVWHFARNPEERKILRMKADGFDHKTIAVEVGLTRRQMERRLRRIERRICGD